LTKPDDPSEFAATYQINHNDLNALINRVSSKLFEARSLRMRPSLDDKILLSWNALAITGLVDASLALDSEKPLKMAEKAIIFLETNLIGNGTAYRSFREKRSETSAFLEDYAFLIQAYTKLYQATFNEHYLTQAKHWCALVIQNFYDTADGYFHFSSSTSEKLIAGKKEVFDNVIPSANSVMARNLLLLSAYFEIREWQEMAMNMITKLSSLITTETAYMANWGMAHLEAVYGFEEIAISGQNYLTVRKKFGKAFLPFAAFAGSDKKSLISLLENREPEDESTMIYVCRNKTCRLPVRAVSDALNEIRSLRT
jgi:uncharacterized protein YyaL (SSP411 family)